MKRFIDKNKLSKIRKYLDRATLQDLKYAYSVDNLQAVYVLLENEDIRMALYNECRDSLDFEERQFLLRGIDPKDIVDVIKSLQGQD